MVSSKRNKSPRRAVEGAKEHGMICKIKHKIAIFLDPKSPIFKPITDRLLKRTARKLNKIDQEKREKARRYSFRLQK